MSYQAPVSALHNTYTVISLFSFVVRLKTGATISTAVVSTILYCCPDILRALKWSYIRLDMFM
jgi:hypothetical protein